MHSSIGQIAGFETDNAKPRVHRKSPTNGATAPLPTDTLLVLQGLSPKGGNS
ncbi:MAG: hypothetical protein IPI14_08680 [Polaromonas sp.]|nr:hypothetical protein [Polaromonas sp.]